MTNIVNSLTFIALHWDTVLTGVLALLAALIAVFHALMAIMLIIPGSQPEKGLQSIVDCLQNIVNFLTKFSAK